MAPRRTHHTNEQNADFYIGGGVIFGAHTNRRTSIVKGSEQVRPRAAQESAQEQKQEQKQPGELLRRGLWVNRNCAELRIRAEGQPWVL